MSQVVKHKPDSVCVHAWPEGSLSPMLILRVDGDYVAGSAFGGGGWHCTVFDSDADVVIVPTEDAAREWLTAYGWEIAA